MRDITDYSERYAEQPFEKTQIELRKNKIIDIVNQYTPANILEIGCGTQPFFINYKNFEKLVIIEPSEAFYNNALYLKERNPNTESEIKIFKLLFEDAVIILQNYSFDFIIISSLLHEVENARIFLEKLHEVIDKHTIIHVNVPNAYSFHRLLAYEIGIINSVYDMSDSNKRLQQFRIFDLHLLKSLITDCGYEILDSGSYFIKPFTHKQMQEIIENNIIDLKILEGLNKMTKYIPDMGSEIFINFKLK